jgi:hypothetical protein
LWQFQTSAEIQGEGQVIRSAHQQHAHPAGQQRARRDSRSARRTIPGLAAGMILAVTAAACSSGTSPGASSGKGKLTATETPAIVNATVVSEP